MKVRFFLIIFLLALKVVGAFIDITHKTCFQIIVGYILPQARRLETWMRFACYFDATGLITSSDIWRHYYYDC